MDAKEQIGLRRQARAEKALVDQQRLAQHVQVVEILADAARAGEALSLARQQIAKWRIGGLCAPRYISEWERILDLPLEEMAAIVLADSAAGVDLRQNSPFGFLLSGRS